MKPTNTQIFNEIEKIKKGAYATLDKVKDFGNGLVKFTHMVIRLGVNYANMKVNAGKEVGSLPWGEWVDGYEGLVIEHKGNYYLRVSDSFTNNNTSRYELNGNEITKEQATEIVGESKIASKQSSVYNIKFDNIIKVGQ